MDGDYLVDVLRDAANARFYGKHDLAVSLYRKALVLAGLRRGAYDSITKLLQESLSQYLSENVTNLAGTGALSLGNRLA